MYVGRIVAVGRSTNGRNAVMYRVSSRSFPNRQAVDTARGIAIVPREGHEGDVFKNPYIAYNCLRIVAPLGGVPVAIATNGSQTDPIAEKIESGMSIRDALVNTLIALDYEKDDFNTPRIAAVVETGGSSGWLGVVRQDGLNVRSLQLENGKAWFLATYETNDITEDNWSAFHAINAREAADWVMGKGRFAELDKPVTAAAAMEGDNAFDTAVDVYYGEGSGQLR